MRHVAWPTRTQTIVYTILVVLLSVGVSLYLGLFDYIFTTGLARFLESMPRSPSFTVEQIPVGSTTATTTPTAAPPATTSESAPKFEI